DRTQPEGKRPMRFLNPWLLFFLVIPAVLLAWVWLRGGPRLVLPFDHAQGKSRGAFWWVILTAVESIPALLLAVAVLLLAGPQRVGIPESRRSLTNIQLVVDVSGSMTSPFGDGSRYDAAMKSAEEFITYRKGDAFGLTFFGNNYLHWVPLTSD